MKDTLRGSMPCDAASRDEGDVILALLAIGDALGEIATIIARAVGSDHASIIGASDQLGAAAATFRRQVDEFLERIRPA